MKKIKCFVVIIYALLLAGCAQKVYSPQLKNNATTEEGTIRIQSSGLGNNLPEAYNNAVENAFAALLFRGIPESIQTTPLIPDEMKAKEQFPKVLGCFRDKNCYEQFLTAASKDGNKERVKGSSSKYEIKSDVTINVRALRTYLEQNNVIRKFGY